MNAREENRERARCEELKDMVKYGKGFKQGQADHFSGKASLSGMALNYCNAAWRRGYKDGYNYQHFGK